MKTFYVANASFIGAVTFIKLSLLFQYLRIYERGSPIHRFCVWLIVVISVWGIVFSFMAWVPCFPVHGYWDQTADSRCYGFGESMSRLTFIVHTSLNMLFDLLVLAIPVPLYFDKHAPFKQRLGMLFLLLLGCL